MTVGAVYIPPTKELKEEDLDLMTTNQTNFIYGGDFNAKHTDWNSRIRNRKGQTLQTHAQRQGYDVLGPISPTSTPPNGIGDVIDIFLLKPQLTINTIETMYALNSDHNSVLLEEDLQTNRDIIKGRKLKTTDWNIYRQEIDKTNTSINNNRNKR